MNESRAITINKAIRKLFYSRKVCTSSNTYKMQRLKDKDKIILQKDCKIEPYSWVNQGNVFCTMGAFSYTHSPLKVNFNIGRYVSIAGGLTTIGPNHPYDRFTNSTVTYTNIFIYKKAIEDLYEHDKGQFALIPRIRNEIEPITIGHDVWIGAGVTLKPGITIGQGAVIVTRALVTHNVPPYSIWGGGAAKQIKMRFTDKIIDRLIASEWWEYAFPQFAGLNILEPLKFCEGLEELKANGLKKFKPEPLTFDEIVEEYENYQAFENRINRAKNLAQNHWVLGLFIKQLVDKKKYKKLNTDPEKFFDDSKSKFIRFLGKYYN